MILKAFPENLYNTTFTPNNAQQNTYLHKQFFPFILMFLPELSTSVSSHSTSTSMDSYCVYFKTGLGVQLYATTCYRVSKYAIQ